MTWRGPTSPLERLFACLPYLLPLVYALPFGEYFFQEFPDVARVIRVPLSPLLALASIPFAGFIAFLALFFLVIRNPNISHFIRFNAMQAILLDIILILCNIIFGVILMPTLGNSGLIVETLSNVAFLGGVVAVVYSMVQSGLGQYAEIPTISDAVYMQVR